jgi:hypothetical protein
VLVLVASSTASAAAAVLENVHLGAPTGGYVVSLRVRNTGTTPQGNRSRQVE